VTHDFPRILVFPPILGKVLAPLALPRTIGASTTGVNVSHNHPLLM
jgi:hypothetical protein